MKLRKLDARGVAHHFLLALIVVGIAVGGTYYLIASHADTCGGTSGPTSGVSDVTSDPTSGACNPDSSPVTAPVSGPQLLAATCTINGVSATPAYGSTLSPTVSITNTGAQDISGATITEAFGLSDGQGHGMGGAPTVYVPYIAAGATWTGNLYSYKVPYATTAINQGSYDVSSSSPNFDCSAAFTLPVQPSVVASCNIFGVPAKPAYQSTIKPSVTIHNKGNQPLSLAALGYDFQPNNHGTWGSASIKTRTIPTIAPGGSYTISGFTSYAVSYSSSKISGGRFDVYDASSQSGGQVFGKIFRCSSPTFSLPNAPAPVIACSNVQFDPTSLSANKKFSLKTTVKNIGNATALNVTLGYSEQTVKAGYGYGDVSVGSLAPGQSKTKTISGTVYSPIAGHKALTVTSGVAYKYHSVINSGTANCFKQVKVKS